MNSTTPNIRPAALGRSLAGLLLAACLALPAQLLAQATGAITGRIIDSNTKSFLSGVEVSVPSSGLRTTTGSSGEYTLRNLAPGDYQVNFDYIGYDPKINPATVTSGETTRLDVTLGDEVLSLETFEVIGALEGQAKALNQEKASQNIVDIISSDSFGQFPDKSIADATRRLPGVNVERGQGEGEGRYVTIRGLNADFNAVSLNGVRVTVSNFDSASRSVPLDVVSAKSAETIEVTKTIRPDQDADSIGGAISIRTRSPFDREGRSITAEVAGTYNNLISNYGSGFYLDEVGYEASGSYSDIITKDQKWAAAVTLNTRETPYVSESVDIRGWDVVDDGGGPLDGLYVPTGVLLQGFFDQINQTGATFALEYRPTENDELRINTSFNQRDSRRGRQRQEIRYDTDTFFWNFGEPITISGDTITEFTSDNRIVRQVRDFYEEQQLFSLALDGKHERGDSTLTWLAGYNRGNFEGDPDRDLNVTFQSGFGDNSYQINPGSYRPQFTTGRDRNDPFNFGLSSVDLGTRYTTDDEFVLKTDLEHKLELFGGDGLWKIGAQARFRQRELTNVDRFYDGTTAAGFGGIGWFLDDPNFQGQGSPVANYGPSRVVNGQYDYGFFIDPGVTRNVINQLLASGDLAFTPAGQLDSDVRSRIGSYEATENVYSTYALAQTTIEKWTIMGGVRAELTDTTFETARGIGNAGLFTSAVAVEQDDQYLDILPGLHARYDATKDLVFRAAATSTIARPSYTQLNPSGRVDNTDLTATIGSGKLDPTRSTNLDFLVDYYIGRVGVVSGGLFYKKMTDNVYRFNSTALGATIDGASNPAATYETSEFRNADGADVYGFELSFERDLSFLPEPFDGLGVFANYTFTDSEVDTGLPGRGGLSTPLFGQVEKSYNVGLTYQKYGFQARVAYNWRDAYLDFGGLNDDPNLDRYLDELGTLDITASYAFRGGLTIFGEFRNATNSPDQAYAGNSSIRPQYSEYRDWSATLGLRAQF